MLVRRRLNCYAIAFLLAPAMAIGADGQFELVSERQIPANVAFGAVAADGRSLLIISNGRLAIRPLESQEERELLPAGSIPAAFGAWAG